MYIGYRILGAFIAACGLALCYGAVSLWPSGLLDAPLVSSATAGGVLRLALAGVAAVFGVGNVLAGLVVALLPPMRE
ncbi:MAG: hypothetical protein U1F58_04765 [Burkholderiales bacterium]